MSGSLPSLGSNDGLHFMLDETDGPSSNIPDLHRTKVAIEHIQQKIIRTKELIKAEQKARDGKRFFFLICFLFLFYYYCFVYVNLCFTIAWP